MKAMLALAAISFSAVPADAVPLTVPQLMARHREFAGKTVEVYGYMNECRRLMCGLFDIDDAELIGQGISIGRGSQRVETELASVDEAWVVLRVKVTTACWSPNTTCRPRAPQVVPLHVRRISPPASRGIN